MEAFDLLAGLTARLASAGTLDDIVETVVHEAGKLGFAAVWLAVLDEHTGQLSTLKEVIDCAETTHQMPPIPTLDARRPLGHSFRERRMVNVMDPAALHILEHDGDPVPPGRLALPRLLHEHMRGHPFACGPLLGSRGDPVGALGLASYHGNQPIPDALLSAGLIRAFTDHLGLALERALRIARLDARLHRAEAVIAGDAQIKAVGELAAAVAHDLNNLSGIALLAISVGARSPADAFNVLPRIERANRAIGDLVARLQRIARPPSELEAADLREIVDDILVMLAPILREQGIAIDLALGELPAVRCDAVLIHQVVLNLLINARDALGAVAAGRRRIEVRARDDSGTVRLTVADSGPGIAPEILGRLFQPFMTTKGGSHLGLGLAAAQASLKPFGGQLAAHNAPAGGAVFELALVAAPAGARASAPRPRSPSIPGDTVRHGKILAVDDDPDVVYIIRAYLEPLGYEVSIATGSAQALDAVGLQGFDLVLCDIGMPGRSGLDMPKALRERGYGGKLVLMTGWDSHALSADPRLAEADILLKKPFVGTELIDTIGTLLNA